MECNKEEAVRAKELAEKKMEIKDFSGAMKIAVKAQQLYPALENISQLILVCEVHCAAEKRSYGTDKDWYGILKVEPSADDTSIKKQYRKLALVLHPDKNSFAGATDAFKLIGEAQRVLLDREKRMIHDSKRRAFGNISASSFKQPTRQPNFQPVQPWNKGHSVNSNGGHSGNFQFQQRASTGASGVNGHSPTFWTGCPFCSVKYQFYRTILNKAISCQNCKESFTAYELNAQGASAASTTTKAQARHTFSTKPVSEKKKVPKPQGNANRKRKKRVQDSSESAVSSDSSEPEEDVEAHSAQKNANKNSDNSGFQNHGERRSFRSKRNVSYKENVNDIDNDDNTTPSSPAEKEAERADFNDEKSPKDKQNSDDKGSESANDDDTDEEMEPKVVECPDPEFTDFEKHRKEESFKVGQLWACYDTEDAMPRFYAIIKKISPGFKLQILWLKPDPVTKDEKKWVNADLPVSCGRYKHEKQDNSQDILSFSHLVPWEAGQKAKTVIVIPRKGETWAVFKNWSMNWHTLNEDDEERKFEYEFVEVLSDFDEKTGVRVSYLEKVKGFVCLFKRKEGAEMVIAGSERYRFAHMVPSCRMSGKERGGVPEGSYELDPAALPSSTFE